MKISGGMVRATGSSNGTGGGAGIGGGYQGNGGTVEISGGTVIATGGSGGMSGADIGSGAYTGNAGTLKITGGSVFADKTPLEYYSAAPKAANGSTPLSLATLTVMGSGGALADTALADTGYIIKTGGDSCAYGTKDLKTDAGGKVYFWLPADTYGITLKEGGTRYANNAVEVKTDNTGAATLTEAPADAIAPTVTAGEVNRTGDTAATVKFTSDEAGQYYYEIVNDNAGDPSIDTSGAGTSCGTTEVTLPLPLTAGAKDVWIYVKDAAGNVGKLKIDIAAYVVPSVQLDTPTGLAWDGTTPGKAVWTVVPNAASYTVQLYRDGFKQGSPVTGITASEYDFTSTITTVGGTGGYTFKVTAIGNGSTYTDSAESSASPAYDYTTPPEVLTGTVTISNMNPKIGDALIGSLEGGSITAGTLTYTWKAGGSHVRTGKSYTVTAADFGKTITLEITASMATGTVTSTPTAAVAKKASPSAPSAPTLSSKTHNSVTLAPNPLYEFSKDSTTWQSSNVFDSLTADTAYTFYQRAAETSDTESSAASTGLTVTTDSTPISPAITGVSAGTTPIGAAGGTSVVTVSGTGLSDGIKVTAFDGAAETAITGTTTGSGTIQTVTLTFPENISTTTDKEYTVKASLDGGSNWSAETATVTVSKTTTPPLVTVTSVTVKTAPTKISYTEGETLDLTGLVVTLNKTDSSMEDVALADFTSKGITVNPANGAALAVSNTKVTITHTASGETAEQTITVNAAPVTITSVTVKTAPTKIAYAEGENLDLTGLVVTLNKTDSSMEDVALADFTSKGITVNPANGAALAVSNTKVTVTHTASGETAEQAITVNTAPVTITSVTVKTAPTKTTYTAGENLDLTDLVVTLNKTDSSMEDVALADFSSKGITVSPTNGTVLAVSNTKVTVTHTDSGESVVQAITVNTAPVTVDSVTVKTAPAKTTYTAGELLDLTGLVVTVNKTDSSMEDVALADFTSKGITVNPANGTTLAVSNSKVTVTHTDSGESVVQAITVNTAPVIDASISPVDVSYDLASPADVSTNITWNSAHTVTDVVYATASLATPADYTVIGSILTIKNSYLAAQSFTAGSTADFTISFDEGNPATLTVNIVDNYTPGSNADLSGLTVGGNTVNGFASDTTSYDVVLPYGTQPGSMAAKVDATADDSKAGVSIIQAASLPGSATVEVTAEDGTTKTYTISFTLEAPPAQSSEKDVTGVAVPSGATINGTSITAAVANSVTSQVIGLSVSAKASWKLYSDAGCTSEIADKTVTLSEGANTAYVQVTAEDGSTKVYTLTITRQSSGPSVVLVLGISITGGNAITAKGDALQLAADVTPAEATNKAVTWSIVSGSSYATLNPTGLLTAQSNGTVMVRATAQDGSGIYGELQIAISGQGSGGDGGGGGGGGSYTPEPPKSVILIEKQPNMPTTAKTIIPGTVKDNDLSANITEQMVKDAIKAAQDAAKKSGKEVDGIAVDFNITGTGSYTGLNATIDAGAIDRLKEAGVKFIKIGSTVLDITIDTAAIAEIDKHSTGTVTVSARVQTKLSKEAKRLIGSRPAFGITVGYQQNGKTEHITNFGKGTVTLGIAYKAAANEKTGNLFGVYVDKNGKPQLLTNSSYDNGRLIFSRNSLSTYGVGYKTPAPTFTDTEKHWAKDNIDFVVSRGLIAGTSATTFAPNTAITRADFLMALGKLSGADMSIYKTSSFTDVKTTDSAMPYIEWAVKSKIISGYGDGKFGPNDSITREQMAVMMVNYAKATGYTLPVSRQAVTFADDAKIGTWAKDAVKAIQQTGIIIGKTSNLFDPQGNATRGEASTILRRFIELVIDEGTARGWSQNDAGQWQYIGENGKAVTGWLDIDNKRYYFTKDGIIVSDRWLELDSKWYYFYADGSLAKGTKIDGHEVDENGVRKSK